jgi:hypothetical protein
MLAVITIAPIQTNSIDMIISRGSRVPLTIKNIPINIPKIVAAIFILHPLMFEQSVVVFLCSCVLFLMVCAVLS